MRNNMNILGNPNQVPNRRWYWPRRIASMLALSAALAAPALHAQTTGRLQFNLDHLAGKATESVKVTLDRDLIQLASKMLSSSDPGQAKIKKLLEGLEGIYVRRFAFDKPGQYSSAEIDAIRKQILSPGWSNIVEIIERNEETRVSLRQDGTKIMGMGILVAEPNEVTVVNIVGTIRPEDLADLGGIAGIPRIDLGSIGTTRESRRRDRDKADADKAEEKEKAKARKQEDNI